MAGLWLHMARFARPLPLLCSLHTSESFNTQGVIVDKPNAYKPKPGRVHAAGKWSR